MSSHQSPLRKRDPARRTDSLADCFICSLVDWTDTSGNVDRLVTCLCLRLATKSLSGICGLAASSRFLDNTATSEFKSRDEPGNVVVGVARSAPSVDVHIAGLECEILGDLEIEAGKVAPLFDAAF